METDEKLISIKPLCLSIQQNFSEELLVHFFSQIEKMPHILANSSNSFLNKLNKIKEYGLFDAFDSIFQNGISPDKQIKFLKFLDFLITTSSSEEELTILFSNGLINKIIFYSFNLTTIEILQSYFTVLKEISLKAKSFDPKYLFTQVKSSENSEFETNECPLYSRSVKYINHTDSVVVSAARLIVLNLCLIKYPPLQAYLSESSILGPFDQLIANVGPDEFAFLVDFLNVAPLNLREYIIHKLRIKFSKCSPKLLCCGATFLKDSLAKPMLIDTLSERIFSFPINNPLTLSLLLFCLENKLILLDSAIKYGLIANPEIVTFSKKQNSVSNSVNFGDGMKSILINPLRETIPIISFVLVLKCLEVIYSDPPPIIIETNRSIIQDVKMIDPNRAMQIFLNIPSWNRRYDINYQIEHINEFEKIDDDSRLIIQLFEIQSSLCKWRKKKRFHWFSFLLNEPESFNGNNLIESDSDNTILVKKDENLLTNSMSADKLPVAKSKLMSFPTADGKGIYLSLHELILPNGRSIPTNSIFLEKKKGGIMRKSVDVKTVETLKRSQSYLSPYNSDPYSHHVEFTSTTVESSFEAELANVQREIIRSLIEKLEL